MITVMEAEPPERVRMREDYNLELTFTEPRAGAIPTTTNGPAFNTQKEYEDGKVKYLVRSQTDEGKRTIAMVGFSRSIIPTDTLGRLHIQFGKFLGAFKEGTPQYSIANTAMKKTGIH